MTKIRLLFLVGLLALASGAGLTTLLSPDVAEAAPGSVPGHWTSVTFYNTSGGTAGLLTPQAPWGTTGFVYNNGHTIVIPCDCDDTVGPCHYILTYDAAKKQYTIDASQCAGGAGHGNVVIYNLSSMSWAEGTYTSSGVVQTVNTGTSTAQ